MDSVGQGALNRREHVLRTQLTRLSVALTLAQQALAAGDHSSAKEMLEEAEAATAECRGAMRGAALELAGLD